MDRDATGDITRTDRAFHDFLGTLKDLSATDGSAVCDASSSTTRTDTASDKQSGLAQPPSVPGSPDCGLR